MRLIVGADDDAKGFLQPAEQLREAVATAYADPARVDLVVVPVMEHALAGSPAGRSHIPSRPAWLPEGCRRYLTERSGRLDTTWVGRASAQGRHNRVRIARTAAGLTQAELAENAGVSRQTIVAVEAGDYAPSVFLALSLAHHLGSTVEALFDVEREPLTPPLRGSS